MGVELPASGSAIFHLTFSVADHFVGRFVSVEWPCPVGPRHAGQLSARATEETSARSAKRDARREADMAGSGEEERRVNVIIARGRKMDQGGSSCFPFLSMRFRRSPACAYWTRPACWPGRS